MSKLATTDPGAPRARWPAPSRAAFPASRKPSRATTRTGPGAPEGAAASSGTSSTMCTWEVVIGSSVDVHEALAPVECADVLDDAARQRLRCQTGPLEDARALGVLEELLRDSVDAQRGRDTGLVERLQEHGPAATDHDVVLDGDHQPVLACKVEEHRVHGLDPAGVDD